MLGAGLRVGENISYYILTVFSLTFLVDVAAETRSLALQALLIGAAVQFFAIPLFARLSDRIGRRPVYAFGGLGLAAFSFAFFPMLASGDSDPDRPRHRRRARPPQRHVRPAGRLHHRALPDPDPLFGSLDRLPAHLDPRRLAGPDRRLWLYREYDSAVPVAIYVGVACLISGVTALLARETKGVELSAIR